MLLMSSRDCSASVCSPLQLQFTNQMLNTEGFTPKECKYYLQWDIRLFAVADVHIYVPHSIWYGTHTHFLLSKQYFFCIEFSFVLSHYKHNFSQHCKVAFYKAHKLKTFTHKKDKINQEKFIDCDQKLISKQIHVCYIFIHQQYIGINYMHCYIAHSQLRLLVWKLYKLQNKHTQLRNDSFRQFGLSIEKFLPEVEIKCVQHLINNGYIFRP